MVRLLEIQQFSSCAFWELSRGISVQFSTLALENTGSVGGHKGNVWSLYAWKTFEVEGTGEGSNKGRRVP